MRKQHLNYIQDMMPKIANHDINLNEQTHLYHDLGLDSVALLSLCSEIENHYKIYLPDDFENPPKTIAEMLDLIEKLQLPVLLVARSGLGTLNHTLLSLKALQDRGIRVFAIMMSGPYHDSNRETLRRFSGIPVYELGQLPKIDKKALQVAFSQLVSLEA